MPPALEKRRKGSSREKKKTQNLDVRKAQRGICKGHKKRRRGGAEAKDAKERSG